MKYLLPLITYILVGGVVILISCSDPFIRLEDPREVVDIPGFDGHGSIQIQDINNANEIIGFIGYSPGSSSDIIDLEEPPTCFRILSDGTSFTELTRPGHLATWPVDINDEGTIVGEYLTEGGQHSDFLPGKAYVLLKDGTFIDLHPSEAYSSTASHVTNTDKVFGSFGLTELESRACLFAADSIVELLDSSTYPFSEVHASNNSWVIIYARNQSDEYEYFAYSVLSGDLQKMNISPDVADFSEIKAINDNDLAVGFYVDLINTGRAVGLVYDLKNHTYIAYEEKNRSQGADFLEYNFFDINNSGVIVGWAGRKYEGPLLQLRAFSIHQDFGDFKDVTPENGDIYSEMAAINDLGIAVGYLGLPGRNNSVLNKMMVMDLSQ